MGWLHGFKVRSICRTLTVIHQHSLLKNPVPCISFPILCQIIHYQLAIIASLLKPLLNFRREAENFISHSLLTPTVPDETVRGGGVWFGRQKHLHADAWVHTRFEVVLEWASWGPSCTYTIVLWFSNFSEHQKPLKSLLEHRLLGPIPKASDSGGLGRGLKTWISNNFPDDMDTEDWKTPYLEQLL